jgi:hypothetical protein
MITAYPVSTERLELSTEELIEEREDLKQVSFIESSKTSSELQPPTTIAKIGSAYYPLFRMILQRLASGEELGHEQLSRIQIITTNYDSLLESIAGISWKETLSIYPTVDLRALERLYILRRQSEVIKFLVDNFFLFPFLQKAWEQIRIYFGKSAQVVLEVITDPEVARGQELVIFIRTNLSPDEAFEKLEQLGEGWWLDTPFNVREKLCIDVEFK